MKIDIERLCDLSANVYCGWFDKKGDRIFHLSTDKAGNKWINVRHVGSQTDEWFPIRKAYRDWPAWENNEVWCIDFYNPHGPSRFLRVYTWIIDPTLTVQIM